MKKQEKKFNHNKIEKCRLCNKDINTNSDEWAVIIDYSKKKQTATGFYHKNCLRDLILGKGEIIKRNFEEKLRNFTKNILGTVPQSQFAEKFSEQNIFE